jgi:hypothetical protein
MKISSYLTRHTLGLRYGDQPVNAVQEKQSLFLARTIRNTQVHSAGSMQSFITLKQMVHIVTTGL